ncbi:uncharacterized protein LOC126366048 isoform X2 [Pectinophora gossypiella]|uniref:uncharacterized protein LOC126366048 isoform X2 n=1 Tax=Pectinophora gossypiella TaxID=13191 RepID=UPI00214F4959|nr:uncharacterized protein LOC126366048 isoform X2 [Pectinophora gossypiella]
MANVYWLIESVEQYEGVEDVKRRVEQAVRGKVKQKQLLSVNDKALLNKPTEDRTDHEKRYLYRIIGGLKCFKRYPNVASREGCIVAKLKSFVIDETLLGDGCGIPNYVYFILSGRVQMIESLQVIVTSRLGHKYYTLYDPWVPKEESEQDFEKKWFAAYPNLNAESQGVPKEQSGSGMLPERGTLSTATQTHSRSAAGSILKLRASSTPNSTVFSRQLSFVAQEDKTSEVAQKDSGELDKVESGLHVNVGVNTTDEFKRTSFDNSADDVKPGQRTLSRVRHSDVVLSRRFSAGGSSRQESATDSKLLLSPIDEGRPSVRYSIMPTNELIAAGHSKMKTYFMQVCMMNPGSTFGFGENMRDRRIVALTPVNCILMPKVWLLQRNTANIWTRIQYYLEKKIPNKQQLFNEFLNQRRWEEYRQQLVGDVVAGAKTVNYTTVHDVPYSVRMEEMYDI